MIPSNLAVYPLAVLHLFLCGFSHVAGHGSKHTGMEVKRQWPPVMTYTRPAEAGKQQRIVLAWPSAPEMGGSGTDRRELLPAAADTIAAVAVAVAQFERVALVADQDDFEYVKERLANRSETTKHDIDVFTVGTGGPVLWMRDIAPTFTVRDEDHTVWGIDFNFNGWGGKFPRAPDTKFANSLLEHLGIPRAGSSITAEGGAIEVDGHGTLMASESSLVNENRNPGWRRTDIESSIRGALGIEKFLWVPGVKGLDATDFHIDAVARFVRPGLVLFSNPRDDGDGDSQTAEDAAWIEAHREARRLLDSAMDAGGRRIRIIDVQEPRLEVVVPDKDTRQRLKSAQADGNRAVFSYVNYLLVNGGVIMPQFGDAEADAAALRTVREAFPQRKVVPVNARALGMRGGGIHCASQEIPFV